MKGYPQKKLKSLKRLKGRLRGSTPIIGIGIFLLALNVSFVSLSISFTQDISRNKLIPISTLPIHAQVYPEKNDNKTATISAKSYIIYEKESRVVIASHNEYLRFAPASVAKIMTALVALEHYPLTQVLDAGSLDFVEGSKMGLFNHELVMVQDLLYGLLLPSGNDAAVVLAKHYPGGITQFVNRMNEKARILKLSSTYFIDPTGYSDANTSSAFDLARLASFALENKTFAKIVKTKGKTVLGINSSIPHQLSNLNQLLEKEGIVGVKTGFTEGAGGVLVTSYIHNGKTYIIVVLKSDDRFFDTNDLIEKIVDDVISSTD